MKFIKRAATLLLFTVLSVTVATNAQTRDQQNRYTSKKHTYKKSSKHTPGKFDYYALAMSWSPTYCLDKGYKRRDEQCTPAKPYGFVLHGLWPQYNRGWPSKCYTGKREWVPNHVIKNMRDIMPAKKLMLHEWRKHGTCSGLSPIGYFKQSRELFEQVNIPPRFQDLKRPLQISVAEIKNEFLKANKALDKTMLSVVCGRRNLKEIRICFNKSGKFIKCGRNETQSKLCRSPKVIMPAARQRR